jgi:SAM-dependent methyltransferase
MNLPDSLFLGKNRILDLGGWFKPEPRATHVVDFMPWETRGTELNLAPRPGERFSKATWLQADFLDANFRLPFADGYFDLVLCGQTVEDLASPENLLKEMQRVAAEGVIECPSRLMEQTLGSRDRRSRLPGHPHHHWIVESNAGELVLYSKAASGLSSAAELVPLAFTERFRAAHPGSEIVSHHWTGPLRYRLAATAECRERARQFVRQQSISSAQRLSDRALRLARRTRARLQGNPQEDFSWWGRVVELSRPYSSVPLK